MIDTNDDAKRIKEACDRVKAAVSASKDAYIPVRAGDLADVFTAAGMASDPLAKHAANVAEDGKDGPGTRISVHRDKHLADVLAKVPA